MRAAGPHPLGARGTRSQRHAAGPLTPLELNGDVARHAWRQRAKAPAPCPARPRSALPLLGPTRGAAPAPGPALSGQRQQLGGAAQDNDPGESVAVGVGAAPLNPAVAPACTTAAALDANAAISADNSPGLLGMPGWHSPADLAGWADGVAARVQQLRLHMLSLPPGLPLLAALHDHELLVRSCRRPARYVADFHPAAAWRAAAAAAASRVDAAAAPLYGGACGQQLYEHVCAMGQALAHVVAAEAGRAKGKDGMDGTQQEGLPGAAEGHPRAGLAPDVAQLAAVVARQLRHDPAWSGLGPASQWLQLCRVLLPLFQQPRAAVADTIATEASAAANDAEHSSASADTDPGTTGASSHDGADSHGSLLRLQAALAQCSEALRRLAEGRPPVAPRLALHPEQWALLRPWLPEAYVEQADAELKARSAAAFEEGAAAFGEGAEATRGAGAEAGVRGLAAGSRRQVPAAAPGSAGPAGDGHHPAAGGAGAARREEGVGVAPHGGAVKWVEWVSPRELLLAARWRAAPPPGPSASSAAFAPAAVAVEAVAGRQSGRPVSRPPRLLQLHGGAAGGDVPVDLDLDALLLDVTDEALELAAELAAEAAAAEEEERGGEAGPRQTTGGDSSSSSRGQSSRSSGSMSGAGSTGGGVQQQQLPPLLPVLALTPEVSGRLLQLHPNEGLRWQVYHSGPLRQARALLRALDELVALRAAAAAAHGTGCWSDLALRPGGGAGVGGGLGGGGLGSALGGRRGAERLLRDLAAGLSEYGDSELATLQRAQRRRGGSAGGGGGAQLDPQSDPLDPWNLPYVLQAAAQAAAVSRYDTGWGAAYADYFAPPGLLRGSDALCRALFGLGLVGPLPLAPGEAAGWVQPETAEEEEGQGRRRQRQQQQQQAKGSQRPDDSADGGSDGGGGGPGEGDRGVGNDVVLKAEVVCAESGSTLGTVYFHLHGRLSEFPFTTLLRHGPCGAATAPAAAAAAVAVGGGRGDGDGDCGGGHGSSQVQVQGRQVQGRQVQPPQQQPPCPPSQQGPVVLVRLPYRAESRSECGGPDSPYFLKAWLHELGHALHHIASAAAAPVTHASAGASAPSGPSATVATSAPSPSPSPSPSDPHRPQQPPGGRLALLSGVAAPLDVREVPAALMEHVLRQPAALRRLARHGRLDCPLPDRDCARLVAQLATCFTSTVTELQSLVAAALADQLMHGPLPITVTAPLDAGQDTAVTAPAAGAAGSGGRRGPGPGPALRAHLDAHAAVSSLTAYHMRQQQQQLQPQPPSSQLQLPQLQPPLLVPGPDVLHHLEAGAVVGGAQYVYVLARLVAAAAWRAHMEEQVASLALSSGGGGLPGGGTGRAVGGGGRTGSGGRLVRRRLLEAGAHVPGVEVLRDLLGAEAFVQLPPLPQELQAGEGSSSGGASAMAGAVAAAGGDSSLGAAASLAWAGEECWVPDLGAEVFQDVDLLG